MEEEIASLKAHVAALEQYDAPVQPDAAIGRLSRLDTMMNQQVARASLSQAKQRLLRLHRALRRLETDPDFGECAECGEPIAPARLLALPETELCVECAE